MPTNTRSRILSLMTILSVTATLFLGVGQRAEASPLKPLAKWLDEVLFSSQPNAIRLSADGPSSTITALSPLERAVANNRIRARSIAGVPQSVAIAMDLSDKGAAKMVDQHFVSTNFDITDRLMSAPVAWEAKHLMIFPDGTAEGFAKMFDRTPSKLQLATVNEITKQAQTTSSVSLLRPDAGADALLDAIGSSEQMLITITGHNDAGEMVFGSGARIPIKEIAQACAQAHKICVFLSCNSGFYLRDLGQWPSAGAAGELTYFEALAGIRAMNSSISSFGSRNSSLGPHIWESAAAASEAIDGVRSERRVVLYEDLAQQMGYKVLLPAGAVTAGYIVIGAND